MVNFLADKLAIHNVQLAVSLQTIIFVPYVTMDIILMAEHAVYVLLIVIHALLQLAVLLVKLIIF